MIEIKTQPVNAGIVFINFGSDTAMEIYQKVTPDAVDFDVQLRKLKKLYDDQIITKEEYEAKKNQILKS